MRSLEPIMAPTPQPRDDQVFEAVFETAPTGLAVLDGDLRILRVNSAFVRLLGYSTTEAAGKPLADLVGFPGQPQELANVLARLRAGDSVATEAWCRRKDGQPAAIAFFGAPLALSDGAAAYCVLRDITEQRLAEEESVRAASLHRATLESTADGLLVVDHLGRALSYNHQFLEMWRIPEDLMASRADAELLAFALAQVAEPDQFLARVRELYANPDASSYDEIRFRDGRTYERYSQPQRLAGQSVGRVWSFRDVTERRRAVEQLKESQRLLELFFAQSLDGFFFMLLDEPVRWDEAADKEAVLDYVFSHQRVTKVNDAMLTQYGARLHQLVGQTPTVLFAHDLAYGREVWRRFFDAGHLHLETHERMMDGTPILIEGDYICLYTADGRIEGHFGIQRDVTVRRREEEELLRSRQELRDLTARLQSVREEERTHISREIHDELGQALTGLKLDFAWLRSRLRDRPELLERAQLLVGRIDGTIDSVRRIATELRPSVLDHLGLVAAVEWQAQEFEKRTGIASALSVRASHAEIDDRRATTVFRILQETLTNVARHAEAGRVEIGLSISTDLLTLEVHDDGRGISEREIAAPHSLGLVGLRERALACGGELAISGIPQGGTTVSVRIPLRGDGGPEAAS